MTEQEWLECVDPRPMLEFLRGKTSERKLRLFACACCRLLWRDRYLQKLPSGFESQFKSTKNAVEVAEQFADGNTSKERLACARAAVHLPTHGTWQQYPDEFAATAAFLSTAESVDGAAVVESAFEFEPNIDGECNGDLLASAILREIIGSPFRPLAADPTWLTATVASLAQGIYDDRAFDRSS